jgi:hypothetical protein
MRLISDKGRTIESSFVYLFHFLFSFVEDKQNISLLVQYFTFKIFNSFLRFLWQATFFTQTGFRLLYYLYLYFFFLFSRGLRTKTVYCFYLFTLYENWKLLGFFFFRTHAPLTGNIQIISGPFSSPFIFSMTTLWQLSLFSLFFSRTWKLSHQDHFFHGS